MPIEQSNANYLEYLLKRSLKGLLYRKLFVYPKIRKRCEGLIIDVGCGICDFVSVTKGSKGFDIDPEIVNWCNKKNLNAELMPMDMLPIENQSVDTIVFDNVIEHMENPRALIHEFERCLKDNGVLIIGVPGLKGFRRDQDHKVFYDEEKISDLVQFFRFKHIETFYTPFKSTFWDRNLNAYCCYTVYKRENDNELAL